MYKSFNLPATTQKDYYGKAVVIEDGGNRLLKSYSTIVASIDKDGNFHRHWYGYSRTTMNHIRDFCRLFNIECGGAAWWREQPVTAYKWSA